MNNLIIDGNYILHKNVFTAHKMNRLYGDLWTLLDMNVNKYVAMNKWDNIIIVCDSRSKSWRKKILESYKSDREKLKNNDIDWQYVYKTYYDWSKSLEDKYTIFLVDTIEGDDWIASLLQKYNKDKKSNVVISSDGDLKQLCKYKINGKDSWINIQISDINGSETVYLPIGWQIWYDKFKNNMNTDIFNLDNSNDNIAFFNKITTFWNTKEIDNYEILFVKLIWGDKSDSIPSIRQTLYIDKEGNSKIRNIGEQTAKKIWNYYKNNFKTHFKTNEQNFISDVIICVENVLNLKFNEIELKDIEKQLKRNIQLIELNYKHYPSHILEKILEQFHEKI